MNYQFLSKFLFKLEPEVAHRFSLLMLKLIPSFLLETESTNPITIMNITFPNRLGLAAGFDKSGEFIDTLSKLGFGHIEVGTVTPRPQAGNTKPRICRIESEKSLWNKMGFPNRGVYFLVSRLKDRNRKYVLGINIGKNSITTIERAIYDYVIAYRCVYPFADYVTINISSPNTVGLRQLQYGSYLNELLERLKLEQINLEKKHEKYVPLVLKISPDLTDDAIEAICSEVLKNKIDGVIATNTTNEFPNNILPLGYRGQGGGISGKLLTEKSFNTLTKLRKYIPELPIISVGGIMDTKEAVKRINHKADLIQIYSSLIYSGPRIVKDILNELRSDLH